MDHSSIHDAFAATADRTPGRDFLVTEAVTAQAYGIPEGTATWRQAREQVERLRRAYAEAGWGHGHRVGLLLENRPAFLYHWLALNALGVSVVPVNAEMRLAELSYLIGHSEVGLIVSLPQRLDDLREAAREAGRSVRTMTADDLPVPPPASPAPLAGMPVGSGTECALLYTSGTTGRPKGCMLDNAYFLRAGQWYSELGGVCAYRRDQERVMTPLPLNHVNAMAFSTMVVLVAGGCLIQLDRFHPKSWLESARVCGATIVHYLGVMPAMLLSAPPAADRDHRIRWGFGAGVDKKNHAPFEERFGFPLVEAWAMTETGAAACIMADKEPRHVGTSCFGRCEDFVQIRLVDDAGSDVPDGTPGELLVRSSGGDPRRYFFRGYLKDEAATDAAWADGWFHTGDVVCRDGEGSLYFVDRKKNVIRRSGENIAAVEVESVLNRHPAVRLSAVAAAPDEVRGDEVMACIVLNENAGVAADESLAQSIVRHALAQLAYYKAPGYVAFVDALPLTTSQKIQRGALKQLALSLLSEGGCFDTRSMKRRQV
ncbi:AMP-binding protein [uncultured Castellaniella sp.]|uniref:AMP-binding protein n=1 Tax=uncultured Castellaniella sp. TaxID=647907 RepID=UPI00260F0F98|nr:AMP-binding protein [uncultured Castellaniella sp.]